MRWRMGVAERGSKVMVHDVLVLSIIPFPLLLAFSSTVIVCKAFVEDVLNQMGSDSNPSPCIRKSLFPTSKK